MAPFVPGGAAFRPPAGDRSLLWKLTEARRLGPWFSVNMDVRTSVSLSRV